MPALTHALWPGLSAAGVQVIDSHTAGEPTRVVVAGGPDVGSGPMAERLARLREQYDGFRSAVVCEPRGSQAVVGALLCSPVDAANATGILFFNDVGYLGMCGHGTIGVVTTLAHLGRIGPGWHGIETPAGVVHATLHADGQVTVENVVSYRYAAKVRVGAVEGEIAWGGNWFFLAREQQLKLDSSNVLELTARATALRAALAAAGFTGEGGAPIDHIEYWGPAFDPQNHARNFVLCPGSAFDRSPCGTGTSAKLACLAADGLLAPGEEWRQEGILGTVFTAGYQLAPAGLQMAGVAVMPSITGRAFVTAEARLLFDPKDPFAAGIRF
jgi:4-hydroxyproline epimerase